MTVRVEKWRDGYFLITGICSKNLVYTPEQLTQIRDAIDVGLGVTGENLTVAARYEVNGSDLVKLPNVTDRKIVIDCQGLEIRKGLRD